MKQGIFITFEGGDGAGKTTQIRLLEEFLRDDGYRVLLTREPGGTDISESIRQILLDPANGEMSPMTECMLYAAARAQLVDQVIRPSLGKGTVVICDRFVDSSYAYQAFGRDLGDAVEEINRHGIGDCMPDLTIYLRLDPSAGKGRISDRHQDRMESEPDAFHQKVFRGYEKLCERYPERILAVDASGTIQEIASVIRQAVTECIRSRKG